MALRITTAAVLAGGAGSRLGGRKADARLGDRSLIEHVLAAIREARIDPFVVAKRRTVLPDLDAEIIHEPDEPRHPLAGIVTALEASADGVLVLACDLPFVPPELIRRLAGLDAELAVCGSEDGLEPLVGRYPAAAAKPLAAALRRMTPVREAVANLSPRVIGPGELAEFGDPATILLNVNTPADVVCAEALLEAAAR